MLIVTIIHLLSVFLTFLSRYRTFRYGFEFAILILICFFGVRYEYGNDYISYSLMFDEIQAADPWDFYVRGRYIERGWFLLNKLFSPLGFPSLVFFHTIVQFGSIYYFFNKYIERKYLYIAVFIYLFSASLSLTMISMMRQTMAMSIMLFAIPFLLNRKYIYFSILVICAAMFHNSALIMFSILLFPFVRVNIYVLISIFLYMFPLLFAGPAESLIQAFVGYFFEAYLLSFNSFSELSLGGSGILYFLLLLLFAYFLKNKTSYFVMLNIMAFVTIPYATFAPLLTRVSSYFLLGGIVGFVEVLNLQTRISLLIKILFLIYLFFIIYTYIFFFQSKVNISYYSEYHTIFEF